MNVHKKSFLGICKSVIVYIEALCQFDFITSVKNGCAGRQ